MSEKPKFLPKGSERFPSIQVFQQVAQDHLNSLARAQGKAAPQVAAEAIQIHSGEPGDGKYSLIFASDALKTTVAGNIDVNRQDMVILSDRPTGKTPYTKLRFLEMGDGCSLTKKLVGENELPKDKTCQDGAVEPRLVAARDKYESIQKFESYCQEAQRGYLQKKYGRSFGGLFSLNRARVLNPNQGNGTFSLFYDNPVNGFACQGLVQTRENQLLMLAHGSREEIPAFQLKEEEGMAKMPDAFYEMTDACRMTQDVVGSEEFLLGKCHEFSKLERGVNHFLEGAWDWGTSTMAALGTYSLFSGVMKRVTPKIYGRTLGPINDVASRVTQPVLRPLIKFRGWMWQGVKALPDQGVRALRQLPQLGRGLLTALRETQLFARLAAPLTAGAGGETVVAGGAVLAGTEGTAVAGGTAAAAGTGFGIVLAQASGAQLAAAFGVGLAIGVGLEKTQQALFGTSVSDKLGDWMFQKLGPADQDTVEWVDKYLGWL